MSRPRPSLAWFTAACLVLAGCGQGEAPSPESDFAVLAQAAEGFEQARPGRLLTFPRDHGAHERFRIEWWYLTANLEDGDGSAYGAQWTLFRLAVDQPVASGTANAWQNDQVYMAHFAVTSATEHHGFQRYSRGGDHGGLARAGVTASPFAAWLDDWVLQSSGADWLPLEVRAREGAHALDLRLASELAPVLQGERGFSQKHPDGGGSYYYSQPFLQATGELTLAGETIPVSGQAWLDREWSSQFLQTDQAGWDWFSLHLESGEKLMLFQLRQRDGPDGKGAYRHGVLIRPDGGTVALEPGRIKLRVLENVVVEGRELPLRWSFELPQVGRSFEIRALHPEQWMDVDFPYWEGAVTVSGEGPENRGRGYMELTGYSAAAVETL
jgi:predicted secreted hydrolase